MTKTSVDKTDDFFDMSKYLDLRAKLLRSKELFKDPKFPAEDSSIFYKNEELAENVEWMRPHEVMKALGSKLRPQFIVEGIDLANDICVEIEDHAIDDAWFLAALATVRTRKEFFSRIVPLHQNMDDEYAGIFHFRFWQDGDWVDVMVDDRLPFDVKKKRLAFCRNDAQPNEFWCCLIEKAYAKLCGSYEAMEVGHMVDALVDMTGGVSESLDLAEGDEQIDLDCLWRTMRKAYSTKRSIMGTYVAGSSSLDRWRMSLSYAVVDCVEIRPVSGRGHVVVRLIRVRNPWGAKTEWKGAWSDDAPEWKDVDKHDLSMMGVKDKAVDDGEFWIALEDFVRYFTQLFLIHLTPDSMTTAYVQRASIRRPRRAKPSSPQTSLDFSFGMQDSFDAEGEELEIQSRSKNFIMSAWTGQWIKGLSSGGTENLGQNPQFQLKIEETDADAEDGVGGGEATVIVSLLQRGRRQLRNVMKTENTNMGITFRIFKVKTETKATDDIARFPLEELEEVFQIRQKSFVDPSGFSEISFEREIAMNVPLSRGHYVIMPFPGEVGEEGQFLLRVLTESKSNTVVPADKKTKAFRKLEGRDDQRVKELFDSYAGDDKVIDANELHKILKVVMKKDFGLMETFSIESCRTLLHIMDTDRTFRIEYNELRKIWGLLTSCRTAFMCYDRNKNGKIESGEFPGCMSMLDMEISGRIMEKLVERFSDKHRELNFEAFVLCMAKIHELIRMYEEEMVYDATPDLELDDFMHDQLVVAKSLPYWKREVQKRTVYL